MEKVLKNYIEASNEPYKNHPIANLIRNELPKDFKNVIGEDYQIKGSSGIGRWAVVPQISFINKKITTTPQDGYYVVYLFREDMSGFYLSLNFGAREFNRHYGRKNLPIAAKIFREILQEKFSDVRNYKPMNLGYLADRPKRPTSKDYEMGNIFSIEYNLEDIPSDDYLIEDLLFVLELYDYLYEVRRNTIFSDEELEFFNIETDFQIDNAEKLEDSMCLSIRNYGAISKADVEINKINIIGGQNATGKSTASRLLYCFLKYNSSYRQNLAYNSVFEQIDQLFLMLIRLPHHHDYQAVLNKGHYEFNNTKDIYSKLEIYADLKDIFYNFISTPNATNINSDEIFKIFDKIDYLIETIQNEGNELFDSIIKTLLNSEVPLDLNGAIEFKGNYNNQKFKFSSNFTKGYEFSSMGEFFVNDVIYIDSISFLDINQPDGLLSSNHAESLIEYIKPSSDESKKFLDDLIYKNVERVLYELKRLIDGELEYKQGKLVYTDNNGVSYSMNNTASGIKQIGIIQLLLRYRKLKPNSVLIIDEPEVNLHPGWQFKFAEILVFLVRKLDIKLYINTHSPIFIEAIEVFTRYYDLENETNFYLTQKSGEGKFDFVKCSYNNLYEIYDNLAKPFREINVYRFEAEYKKNKG